MHDILLLGNVRVPNKKQPVTRDLATCTCCPFLSSLSIKKPHPHGIKNSQQHRTHRVHRPAVGHSRLHHYSPTLPAAAAALPGRRGWGRGKSVRDATRLCSHYPIREQFSYLYHFSLLSRYQATLFNRTLRFITAFKLLVSTDRSGAAAHAKWDLVLLGGLMGSLFSFLQFVIAPVIGRLSDRLGRRRTLLLTMVS
ncbi:hypothetical protein BC938DRAFT_477322 [Jimgerdemannia flammicorona]|uniref:Major facilitator superfamily (MFS) profile domain-containing protein n=1 Tax=Jimgerdemannia flammicorona TaxID=994334 RepID=A0A433QPJ0_9FUNG|nr:hypothetical protein BC938DRAFT_477322 [Jimgerdemannia flammicorona]